MYLPFHRKSQAGFFKSSGSVCLGNNFFFVTLYDKMIKESHILYIEIFLSQRYSQLRIMKEEQIK